MPYSSDINSKIVTFINRAQTKLGSISTTIAKKVSKDARYESYRDDAELGYQLDSFVKALDNNWNNWTEHEIEECIEMWNAKASLNNFPYFTHTQYNYNIKFTGAGSTFITQNGGTFYGTINMNNQYIINLPDATSDGMPLVYGQAAGGDLTGTYPNPTLTPTGVTPDTYGDSNNYPVVTVDSKGRITAITEQSKTGGSAGGDLTGTYPNPTLTTSGVSAGTYGDSTHYPVLMIDAKGRATAASQTALPTALPPNGSAGGDLAGTYPNPTIKSLGLTPGAYGNSSNYPIVTVNAKGQVTAITTAAVAIPNTAVTPGTYGDASNYPVITIGADGRITAAANQANTGLISFKKVNFTSWNMLTTPGKQIAHGVDKAKITGVIGVLYGNGSNLPYPFSGILLDNTHSGPDIGFAQTDGTFITFYRRDGSDFVSAGFNNASGKITIFYES